MNKDEVLFQIRARTTGQTRTVRLSPASPEVALRRAPTSKHVDNVLEIPGVYVGKKQHARLFLENREVFIEPMMIPQARDRAVPYDGALYYVNVMGERRSKATPLQQGMFFQLSEGSCDDKILVWDVVRCGPVPVLNQGPRTEAATDRKMLRMEFIVLLVVLGGGLLLHCAAKDVSKRFNSTG